MTVTMPEVGRSVVRLRPIVHASPVPNGVHVRGWSSSFTVEGGADLWRVWLALARRLAGGVPDEQVAPPTRNPEVARALDLIVSQLRAHDMLVEVPAGWGEPDGPGAPDPDLAAWLESVAPRPATAWQRLRTAGARLVGDGPVLEAARRTLAAAGVTVHVDGGDAGTLLAVADTGTAVAAWCDATVGIVVPTGPMEDVRSTMAAVLGRVRPKAERTGTEPPYPLAALAGAAAAHRLVCAVADLMDPALQAATLTAAGQPVDDHPAVLVVRLDPLSATYHPWVAARASRAGRPRALVGDEPAADVRIDGALRGLDVICDPELGALPVPELDDLPQLPACLAATSGAIGVGVTADAARLGAALRAAERALDGCAGRVSVGADERHALGVALRRRVYAAASNLDTEPVPAAEWERSPTVRRWWKTLTLRLGVAARVDVRRLHTHAVWARVVAGSAERAWAIEASAADAVAFAVLAAVGVEQASRAGVPLPEATVLLTGAAPAWRPEHTTDPPWTDAAWYWPADVDHAEARLQAVLGDLAPGFVRPVPVDVEPALVHSLARVGFHAVVDGVS
jgi:hypothetical protein